MEKVYQIMEYDYDGCGQSYDDPTWHPLKRTLESAEKVIREYENDGFQVVEDDYYGLVAIERIGRYAYTRIYIAERELED